MYVAPHHRFVDRAAQLDLIDAYPLATWLFRGAQGLAALHRPFTLDRGRGELGTLRAGIDADDTEARAAADGTPALLVFLGPQAYISPGWYPGKVEHGRVVPTWNYVTVHAHGTVRWTADRAAVDVPILRLEAKLKASQDEARCDREGTVRGLCARADPTSAAMAGWVQNALDRDPAD